MFQVGKTYTCGSTRKFLCVGSYNNLGWVTATDLFDGQPWTEQWSEHWKEYREPIIWYYAIYYDNNDDLSLTNLFKEKDMLVGYLEKYCIRSLAILNWVEK